jgi:hypothetical protein
MSQNTAPVGVFVTPVTLVAPLQQNCTTVWCTKTKKATVVDRGFEDFLLSPMLAVRGSRESEASADDDQDWHSEVTLEVGPHFGLSETQVKVNAPDYDMRGGRAKINFRQVLLYYALRRLWLDTDPSARNSLYHQIVLLNREVIDADHR